MGLRDELGVPGGSPRARLWALLLAVMLLSVSFVPSASAGHDDAGVSFEPWLADCGGQDWIGFQGAYGFLRYRFCFSADSETPTFQYGLLDKVKVPPNLQRADCPEGFHGEIFDLDGTEVGFCVSLDHRIPTQVWPSIGLDLTACEVPGDREGEDPAVFVADGGVAVCVLPVLDPGFPVPDVMVSPEPCEPKTVDPEVRIGDGGAEVCFDVSLMGVGSEDVNRVVQEGNETAVETVDFAGAFTGLNQTAFWQQVWRG